MIRAVWCVVGVCFSFVAQANSFDDMARRVYEIQVRPHFVAYTDCGLNHFGELGRAESRSFSDVEITVAQACGSHIELARSALSSAGLRDRKGQNSVISAEYRGIVPKFKAAYEAAQKQGERTKVQVQLQDEWTDCLSRFVAQVIQNNSDGASTIARGAIVFCQSQEDRLYDHLKSGVLGPEFAAELVTSMRIHNQDKVIALVLSLRSVQDNKRTDGGIQSLDL